MERNLFSFLVFLCIASIPFSLKAQDYTLDVEYIGVEKGLLHREVRTVFEDRNGFIWIGGIKGLQRYDGLDFKTWTKADKSGLLYYITAIGQDDQGWLWLWNNDLLQFVFLHSETEEILTEKERFGNDFPIHRGKGKKGEWISGSARLPKNSKGELIFGTAASQLISYGSKSGFQFFQLEKGHTAAIEYVDHDNFIWLQSNFIGQEQEKAPGIFKMNNKGEVLAFYPIEQGWEYGNLSTLNDQVLLQYTSRAIDRKGRTFFTIAQDGQLKELDIKGVTGDVYYQLGDQIWVLTHGKSWKVYTPDLSELLYEINRSDYHISLINSIHRPFIDSRGIIWIYGDLGISKIRFQQSNFKNHFSFKSDQEKSFDNSTRGIIVHNDQLISNFEKSGTYRLNLNDHNSTGKKIGEDQWARPISLRANGHLLIGMPFSIKEINPDGELIEEFFTKESQEISGIWSFQADKNEKLWIGAGAKLAFKNKSENFIQLYQPVEDPHGFTTRRGAIQNMIPRADGKIWFCSWTGLYLFDPVEEKIIARYASDENGKNYLPADLFYYLYKDDEGVYWLGTADGLIRWEGPDGKHQLFTRSDGLSNDVIYAIFEDQYNRLWMSSDYGLMSFDKETYNVQAYLENDGISHHEFNRTAQFKAEDGTLYFGGLNGITSFHPKNFVESEKDFAKMQIADFEIFDGQEEKLVNRVGELRVSNLIQFHPNDRFFRLKFVLPTYDNQTQILYAWKIDGVDKDWNFQKENTLQIGALPYGKHQLHVKGQSGGGGWSPHELNIEVDVRRPFYLQSWFILFAILSLISGVLGFLRVRTRVLKREIDKATNQIQKDKSTIEEQTIELQKLDKLKSRFFANVSHELRTPLALMIGPINQLIKKNGHDPKDRKLLEFIQRNSLHLKRLVTEILDLSKLENNKLELNEEPVEFYPYFHKHIIQYYSIGNSENISFGVNFRSDKELSILLDKNKFEKVINNYLSNAIKFTPPGGEINVEVLESATDLTFTVIDNGRGIHPDDLPHVFDRFYQSNQTDAPTEGGTGIGLSFSKELAQLMGGKVWAESTLKKGSQFHFQMPIKKVVLSTVASLPIENDQLNSEPTLELIKQPTSSKFKQAKILIAEDNRDLREYYKIILSDFQVVLSENGRAALDYLESANDPPDLIISDLMMPVMDGFQFLEKIKSAELWRGIPVIMLTAKTNRLVKLKALRIGIDDYVTKPFDDEELLVRIENLLDHYSSRKSYQKEEQAKENNGHTNNITREEIQWLVELEKYVINNLEDQLLTVELLSRKFAMSKSTLLRQLRKTTGLTPSKYIQEHRLNIARQLIENREYKTVAQVASKVGFKNANAFSRSFKNRFGNTPTEMLAG